jgi:hypothetical protein
MVSCEFTLIVLTACLFADVPAATFRLSLILWPVVIALFSVSAILRTRTLFVSTVLFLLAGILAILFSPRP